MKTPLLALSLVFGAVFANAADRVKIVATHDLSIARPSETIAVPWAQLADALPGLLLQKLSVKDASGHSLPYQVTNVAPQARDPHNRGSAYGELIFQHDFSSGEKSAAFTIERTAGLAPVFPAKTFARYVPERLDDFAWENDKIAHRTYGPALAAPAEPGSGKEVLVTSGLDIWCKRVSYPIVDRWYNKGHDHYHTDEGEGMDMYQVGPSRGCGGTGVWNGEKLAVSTNYSTWKLLANGPIRTIFELSYAPWDAHGMKVAETKRFTVDAGRNFDLIESTFTLVEAKSGRLPAGDAARPPASELIVAVGLTKTPIGQGEAPQIALTRTQSDGSLAQWIEQKTNGSLGTAVIVFGDSFMDFAEDDRNQLVVAKVAPGRPLRYLVGAGWSLAGEFTTQAEWDAYVTASAARLRSPVRVVVSME